MTLTTFVHAYSTALAFSSSYGTSQQLKVDVPRMEKECFHISFLFFSWNICLMRLLPASSSCGFDVSKWCSSCLLPSNRGEKIDVVMSEGEPEGDRRRGKRGEESWRVRRWLLFSPFQAFVDRSTSLPEHLKKSDVMCCWALDDNISSENISHWCSQVTFDTPGNIFSKSCARQVFIHVQRLYLS